MTARCSGSGTPAKNVTRAWVGSRLPVVGDCQTCGRQVEITEKWTTKSHAAPVVNPPAEKPDGVLLYLDTLEGTNPSPEVQEVIDQLRAERLSEIGNSPGQYGDRCSACGRPLRDSEDCRCVSIPPAKEADDA